MFDCLVQALVDGNTNTIWIEIHLQILSQARYKRNTGQQGCAMYWVRCSNCPLEALANRNSNTIWIQIFHKPEIQHNRVVLGEGAMFNCLVEALADRNTNTIKIQMHGERCISQARTTALQGCAR